MQLSVSLVDLILVEDESRSLGTLINHMHMIIVEE